MDPTTTAHTTTNAPIHPAGLAATTDHTGAPILTTTSFPSSSNSTGASNLAAPKSSAPTSDPIAGLSASADANASSAQASADKAKATAQDVKSKVNEQAGAAATGVRKRLNSISQSVEGAADHPAVKNARAEAGKQVEGLRQQLGRYPLIVQAEKRTGVDRVLLVFGGVLLYIILIPLNLFRLALPTTQLLTFLPPSALAVRTLERPHEERTKLLLSYFVVFGFVQFIESLMAGFLEKRIPQYYTVKLLFLAYLIHPKTKGAFKIHQSVLRPLLAKSQGLQYGASKSAYPSTSKTDSGIHTPPSHTARSSDSSTISPGAGAPIPTVGGASSVGAPLSRAGGFSGTGPSEGFSGTE